MEKKQNFGSSSFRSQSGISLHSTVNSTSTLNFATPEYDESSLDFVESLRDLNRDAETTCEFVSGANEILCGTLPAFLFLAALTVFALAEAFIGVHYLQECPENDNIPVFLFVGGCIGTLKTSHVIYSNNKRKKHSSNSMLSARADEIIDILLNVFLLVWQILGMYWTFSVWYPPATEPLYEDPEQWCDPTCYLFAVIQNGVACSLLVCKALLQCGIIFCYKCTDMFAG